MEMVGGSMTEKFEKYPGQLIEVKEHIKKHAPVSLTYMKPYIDYLKTQYTKSQLKRIFSTHHIVWVGTEVNGKKYSHLDLEKKEKK